MRAQDSLLRTYGNICVLPTRVGKNTDLPETIFTHSFFSGTNHHPKSVYQICSQSETKNKEESLSQEWDSVHAMPRRVLFD